MTCIIGIEHQGAVWLGADSAGIAGYRSYVRADAKVFESGPFAMGFTTSFRMGQLLRYRLDVPAQEGQDDDQFMVTVFVDAVRSCLKNGGFAKKDSEVESGGVFLVGYRSRLYRIDSDYQVMRTAGGFDAVGTGEEVALGALYATTTADPRVRIETALAAAEHFNAAVRTPFAVIVQQGSRP